MSFSERRRKCSLGGETMKKCREQRIGIFIFYLYFKKEEDEGIEYGIGDGNEK